jgi:UDP-glucose 4-epimerase
VCACVRVCVRERVCVCVCVCEKNTKKTGDVATLVAEPQKAKEVLGWTALLTLQDMCTGVSVSLVSVSLVSVSL